MYGDDVVPAGEFPPVGVWLGPATCLVRDTRDGPDCVYANLLISQLTLQGAGPIYIPEDLMIAVFHIIYAKVKDLSRWFVWSTDEPTARAAILEASAGLE